jgi:cytochrome c oxidase cbb3-type subunit 3
MLTSFWNWYVIVITIFTILASLWLLRWTKNAGNQDEGDGSTGHVWDEDLVELNNPLPRWWLQLFYITIIFAFVYFALYGGLGNLGGYLGWSQEGQYDAEMMPRPMPPVNGCMQTVAPCVMAQMPVAPKASPTWPTMTGCMVIALTLLCTVSSRAV